MTMVLGPRDVDTVNDPVSAGRLHLELTHQLDQPDLTQTQRADTRAALRRLRTRFPDAEAVARSESPDELGGLPQHLRARQKALRDEAGHDVNATRAERERLRTARGRDREPGRAKTPKAGGQPRRVAGARRGVDATLARAAKTGRRRARRTLRPALSPPGTASMGRLALQAIGTAVGLSLLYLLIRDAERHGNAGAVGVAANTFAQGVVRLVSPAADVLGQGSTDLGPAPALTLDELSGLPDVTGAPVDTTGLPALTPTPPVMPATGPRPTGPVTPTPTHGPRPTGPASGRVIQGGRVVAVVKSREFAHPDRPGAIAGGSRGQDPGSAPLPSFPNPYSILDASRRLSGYPR